MLYLSAAMFPIFHMETRLPAVAWAAGLLFTNHNPAILPSLHYLSALYKVICVARHSVITYDFKQLAALVSI